ncbi:peptidoglycan/LPS O-acetylase OafA/YrhL [Arcanobacterium pluranimalium]|uniref:acyltransferase family protein n=1 Tax=Arcanobacterium pluranimalium TaxID=108028 RepID=UPI00195CE417|nr:acyltransferase family protein [Arcanobacterium pluranimalium]MBM7824351.1 peptidoglycan/LPS O-acetylase OafA/YrhL [Arcanobacterium pluranimalium]
MQIHKPENNTISPSQTFRLGGLDGLRAIACIAVLIYHTWAVVLPGGFLGVDVFFVLSGFLITSLLVKDLENYGTIRIGRFWMRRWRRLFPAVFTSVFVTVPIAALINTDILVKLRSQVAGAFTFTYNWVAIATGSTYFEQGSPNLLTNMWTLAVEQQFYILWPLIMVGLWWLNRTLRIASPLLLAAVSVGLMAYAVADGGDVTRAYMGTDSHAFGLMIGAAAAIFCGSVLDPAEKPDDRRALISPNVMGALGVLGLLGVFASFVFADEHQMVTYPWVMLAVVLCSLFVVMGMTAPYQQAGTVAYRLRSFLDLRAFTWIGERSYGIYLWHWPLVVIWQTVFPDAHPAIATLVIAAISVVAAALSFRFVENPMRYNGINATLRLWFGALRTQVSSMRQANDGDSAVLSKKWFAATRLFAMVLCSSLFIYALVAAPVESEVEAGFQKSEEVAAQQGAQAGAQPNGGAQQGNGTQPNPGGAQPGHPNGSAAQPGGGAQSNKDLVTKANAKVAGENITVLGDSVIAMVDPVMANKWPGIVVDGQKNRSQHSISPLIQQHLGDNTLRHYVVIGVANNGAVRDADIDRWLQEIGPDRVMVLITGHGTARTTWIPESNAAIARAKERHPDQVVIADWYTIVEQNPEAVYRDRTHPNPDGNPLFVAEVEKALNEGSKLAPSVEAKK